MKKLFCIIGKSGAGKDTVFKELVEPEYDNILSPVITYTTRPKRINEVDGREYHFVTDSYLEKAEAENSVIEKRVYDTVHGKWNYFTCDNCFHGNDYYIMIGTPDVVEKMQDYFGDEKVVVIYLELDDGVRLKRCINRESQQDNPNYSEVCRRFLADENDFSPERINRYKNIYRINSDNVNSENVTKCMRIIKECIDL